MIRGRETDPYLHWESVQVRISLKDIVSGDGGEEKKDLIFFLLLRARSDKNTL